MLLVRGKFPSRASPEDGRWWHSGFARHCGSKIHPRKKKAGTPKTGRDWLIFLTLDLDQILGAGHSIGFYITIWTGSRGAGQSIVVKRAFLPHVGASELRHPDEIGRSSPDSSAGKTQGSTKGSSQDMGQSLVGERFRLYTLKTIPERPRFPVPSRRHGEKSK